MDQDSKELQLSTTVVDGVPADSNTHVLALQYSAQLLEILPRHHANAHLPRCLQRGRNGGIITKDVYTSFLNFDSETFFFFQIT